MGYPPNWNRDEAILALDLYKRVGQQGEQHREVQELSRILKELTPLYEQGDPAMFRNPPGVGMKLANFAHLDPGSETGLRAGSQLDESIWNEFSADPDGLAAAAAKIRERIPEPAYWTWVANPKVFRVDDAIRERVEDKWLTKGKPLKVGDRGAVWRSLGADGKRGIIAIGEVISEPFEVDPTDDPYWLGSPEEGPQEFVGVRYVDLEGLPIWSGTEALDELGLNADRARGGTLFRLEREQWLAVLTIARDQRSGGKVPPIEGSGTFYVVRAGQGATRIADFEKEGVVAMGFIHAGDLTGMDTPAVKDAVARGWEGEAQGRIRTFTWQLEMFKNKIQVGDIVVVPGGAGGPLLFGRVVSDYEYRETPSIPKWRHTRRVEWLGRRDRALLSNKTRKSLNAATTIFIPDGQDELRALLLEEPRGTPKEALTMDWLERETLWPRDDLEELVRTLEVSSPQVVLAGPPGTGKTWVAERVARYITQGAIGATRVVQFHPSFSYEDFIEGLRPVVQEGAVSFERVDGLVLEMTGEMEDEDAIHVLVIDEMNRANLPRVFGELMYLFEYREQPVDLRYTRGFSLPSNLRFIGTMNTADRSIRSIDIALRRRFDVFECSPDADILRRYYEHHANEVDDLIEGFEELNAALRANLDRHHTIGHTFFMASPMTRAELQRVWQRKVGPLIEEYFFDQLDIAATFTLERFWP